MLLAGDETGKTQRGNNNAYCHDSPLTWLDWSPSDDADLRAYTTALLHLRRTCGAFRRERFFTGTTLAGFGRKDITWLRPDGTEMTNGDWFDAGRRVIGLMYGDEHPVPEDPLVLMFLSAHDATLSIALPPTVRGWDLYVDTAGDPRGNVYAPLPAGPTHDLQPRSLVVFRTAGVAAR
jgi:glycogen operon protein